MSKYERLVAMRHAIVLLQRDVLQGRSAFSLLSELHLAFRSFGTGSRLPMNVVHAQDAMLAAPSIESSEWGSSSNSTSTSMLHMMSQELEQLSRMVLASVLECTDPCSADQDQAELLADTSLLLPSCCYDIGHGRLPDVFNEASIDMRIGVLDLLPSICVALEQVQHLARASCDHGSKHEMPEFVRHVTELIVRRSTWAPWASSAIVACLLDMSNTTNRVLEVHADALHAQLQQLLLSQSVPKDKLIALVYDRCAPSRSLDWSLSMLTRVRGIR